MRLPTVDAIIERLAGLACMAAAGTEVAAPQILSINLAQAAGLGVFGFLIATGRAEAVVRRLGKFLSDAD
jgi:hypothetical protein